MKLLLLLLLLLAVILVAAGIYTRTQVAEIEERFPPVGKFENIDGRLVHYVDLAPAQDTGLLPVIFVHGASGNLRDQMDAFRERLEGKTRLIFVDRPGHGYTDRKSESDAHPSTQAKVIADLMDRLGIEKAVISGHSFGAAITAALAVNHPEKVHGLMFIAPATHVWPGGVSYHYEIGAIPVLGWLLTETVVLPLGQRSIEPGARSVFAPNPMPEDYLENAGIELVLRPENYRANAQDVTRLKPAVAELSPRYKNIKVPTVIVTGDTDDVVLASIHSVGLERDIDGAELIVLKDMGHKPDYVAVEMISEKLLKLARP